MTGCTDVLAVVVFAAGVALGYWRADRRRRRGDGWTPDDDRDPWRTLDDD